MNQTKMFRLPRQYLVELSKLKFPEDYIVTENDVLNAPTVELESSLEELNTFLTSVCSVAECTLKNTTLKMTPEERKNLELHLRNTLCLLMEGKAIALMYKNIGI